MCHGIKNSCKILHVKVCKYSTLEKIQSILSKKKYHKLVQEKKIVDN